MQKVLGFWHHISRQINETLTQLEAWFFTSIDTLKVQTILNKIQWNSYENNCRNNLWTSIMTSIWTLLFVSYLVVLWAAALLQTNLHNFGCHRSDCTYLALAAFMQASSSAVFKRRTQNMVSPCFNAIYWVLRRWLRRRCTLIHHVKR